jgi:exopolysaccharide biosynthesis protein
VLSGGLTMHERRNVPAWWARIKADDTAVAALNGQFFNASVAESATLAFSVKDDGTTYRGYADKNEYPGAKLALLLGEKQHSVVKYTDDADQLAIADARDAVVGLVWWADKKPRARVARTMIGVSPRGETYVFISPAATQRYAMAILKRFGISQSEVVMLDGGGSSQLSTRDSGQVVPVRAPRQFLRKVPQVLVAHRAPLP